ncbi:MAG: hypothetical protein LUC98_01740 [Lachnospiraceae bacterium]|nr:hypothetical protein [Lachnospiraceae bacterium]
MLMRQKNRISIAIIYVVMFAAYNLFLYLVFKEYSQIFRISYGFLAAMYVMHIICTFSIFRKPGVRPLFFGIPLATIATFFLIAELFCSLVFMFFQFQASVRVAAILQALLLCAFLIIAIVAISARNTIEDTNARIRNNVSRIQGLSVDVEMLAGRCADLSAKNVLRHLSETIKYSDPMTNEAVAGYDENIERSLGELGRVFDGGDMKAVKEQAKKIELLVAERNKRLKISK